MTQAAYDGAARGYGSRVLLVGGLEDAGRVGPVDPGQVEGAQYSPAWDSTNQLKTVATVAGLPLFDNPCGVSNREVVLGALGPDEPVVLDIRPEDREPGYDPVCDTERTAGTCFRSSLMCVYTPDYHCGLCENEQRVIEALNKAIGANGRVRMRQPDPALAAGAENGYNAAVQKPTTSASPT